MVKISTYGGGINMKDINETPKIFENGKWLDAKPIPYYPTRIEKIKHFFGFHTWTYFTRPRFCLICNKFEKSTIGG